MIELHDLDRGTLIGTITDGQLQVILDALGDAGEEASFVVTPEVIDSVEEDGAEEAVVRLLRRALGARDEMELHWVQG